MKTEYGTSKIKKANFIFSEAKSLMSDYRPEKSRAVFVSFIIPIVALGVLYIMNYATDIIEFYFYNLNPIGKTAVAILKFLVCFFIITPLASEIFILCHRIAKSKTETYNIGYFKSLYFFFGLLIRSIFTVAFFLLFCFSNHISYETASYFCIDDSIVFPIFAAISAILFLISLYRLTSFSFVFHLFITDNTLSPRKAKMISRRILSGHFGELLIIIVMFIPWMFLCAATIGILFIYFIPRYLVAKALFFRYIFAEEPIDLKKYNSSYNKRTMEVKANEI